MNLAHRLPVIRETSDTNSLDCTIALMPVEFIADTRATRRDRAGHDRSVALNDERPIDRQPEPAGPLGAGHPLGRPGDLGSKCINPQPGDRGYGDDRRIGQE